MFSRFSHDIAIDLGSSTTRIFERGRGIVARESSYVAFERIGKQIGQIKAFGSQAKELSGRSAQHIECLCPLLGGAIQDLRLTEALLRHIIKGSHTKPMLLSRSAIVSTPHNASLLERRALREVALSAGANQVFLVEQPIAHMIGAALPVSDNLGAMILDLGAQRSTISIVMPGGIVLAETLNVSGQSLDRKIVEYCRKHSSVLIGESSAEQAKIEIGAALLSEENPKIELKGRDIKSSLPKEISITQQMIVQAIAEPLKELVRSIRNVLDRTPPEVASDLIDSGIYLVGAASKLTSLSEYLEKEIGLALIMVEDPENTAILGAGKILEEQSKYKHLLQPS